MHVIRRMFNIDIYVSKCPVKSKRKPLVLTLGLGFVSLSFLGWVGVPGFASLGSRGGHYYLYFLLEVMVEVIYQT